MKRRVYSVVAAVIGMGLAAGCGGDDDGGSTQIDLGVADDKALSDMSEDEAKNACERAAETIQSVLDPKKLASSICTLMAVSITDSESQCNEMRKACLDSVEQSSDEFGDFTADMDCEQTSNDFVGCDVTVGQLEDCMNDSLRAFLAVFDGYSCKDAGKVSSEELDGLEAAFDVEPPASCQPLIDECGGAGVMFGN